MIVPTALVQYCSDNLICPNVSDFLFFNRFMMYFFHNIMGMVE